MSFQQVSNWNTIRTDEASSTVTYVGYAMDAAADPAQPIWAILRITQTSGTSPVGVTLYEWAVNENIFSTAWDNRSSATYR